jgi:hypothetical protein
MPASDDNQTQPDLAKMRTPRLAAITAWWESIVVEASLDGWRSTHPAIRSCCDAR